MGPQSSIHREFVIVLLVTWAGVTMWRMIRRLMKGAEYEPNYFDIIWNSLFLFPVLLFSRGPRNEPGVSRFLAVLLIVISLGTLVISIGFLPHGWL